MRPHTLTIAMAYYVAVVAGLAMMLVEGGGRAAAAVYFVGLPLGALGVWLYATGQRHARTRWATRPIARTVIAGILSAAGAVGAVGAVLALAGWLRVAASPALSALGALAAQQLVVAGIEEYAFRGVLQRLLSRELGQWAGLLAASVLFSLFHLPNIRYQAVPLALVPLTLLNLTAMGLVFGWAYRRSEYLLALPIALHLGWNLVSYGIEDAASFAVEAPQGLVGTPEWFPESGIMGGLALLALAAWLWLTGITGYRGAHGAQPPPDRGPALR